MSEALPEAALAAEVAADPKTLMLCAQAHRALEFAFGAACGDPALAGLLVQRVVPDPSIRRLRVWLRGPSTLTESDRQLVLERLAAARGFLRSHVADAIHRKRTPELAFELLAGTDEA